MPHNQSKTNEITSVIAVFLIWGKCIFLEKKYCS